MCWVLPKPNSFLKTEVYMAESSNESLVELALKDRVTGLYNRKHLLQRLSAGIARSSRSREKMAVILWDIDGFIHFNNQFGQDAGDKFLLKVAEIITGSMRGYDEAFRVGPDEFCALLLPADETVAQEVTRRVRESVSKGLFEGNAEYAGQKFSISSGSVFYAGEASNPEAILHAAGQDLYRNRHANV